MDCVWVERGKRGGGAAAIPSNRKGAEFPFDKDYEKCKSVVNFDELNIVSGGVSVAL